MERDRARVLALFVAYLALVAVALFAMNWFSASLPFGTMAMDLRSAHFCSDAGPCDSVGLSDLRGIGFYAPLAGLTFFGTLLYTGLVGYQAVKRVRAGFAGETASRIGYIAGMVLFVTAFSAAFVFAPEPNMNERALVELEIARTPAPFLLLIALLLGIIILYYAVTQRESDTAAAYTPISTVPLPVMPKKLTQPIPSQRTKSLPPGSALAESSIVPEHLRKKLSYVVLSAEITRAGIDARLEDGSSKLVMWRDVVGLVARRMPAAYDALTFLDIVSVAGSTLRVMPWTRVTGETVAGEGDARLRALLDAMHGHCAEASVDPATKRFQSGEPAAQLKDTKKLAAHDEKLA